MRRQAACSYKDIVPVKIGKLFKRFYRSLACFNSVLMSFSLSLVHGRNQWVPGVVLVMLEDIFNNICFGMFRRRSRTLLTINGWETEQDCEVTC